MTRTIELTQGQVALVSDHRYEWLNQWKWSAAWNERAQAYYAVRNGIGPKGNRTTIYMHRQIMGEPKGRVQVDHKNRNTLDNQDDNLRIATYSQNQMNSKMHRHNKLGEKNINVERRKRKNKKGEVYVYEMFRAALRIPGGIWQKRSTNLSKLIKVRNAKIKELHGEFACVEGCL